MIYRLEIETAEGLRIRHIEAEDGDDAYKQAYKILLEYTCVSWSSLVNINV